MKFRTVVLCAALLIAALASSGLAQAASYTFNLALQFPAPDGFGVYMTQLRSDAPQLASGILQVGWQGALASRSALDFNLARLPNTEVVTSATLELRVNRSGIQDLFGPIGSIRHLDALAPPYTKYPPSDTPADPRRFSWDDIGAAPFVTSLGLGGTFAQFTPFDVTAAIAADHLAGYQTSALGLLEEPDRRNSLGYVSYSAARLTVQTRAPTPVLYGIEPLGGKRYREHFQLANPLSLPLALLDIDFPTELYDEASLSVSLHGAAAAGWQAEVLGSGIGVPATVSFASVGNGLGANQHAAGFDVDFTWLGNGSPGDQSFTVYDAQTFDTLYGGSTAAAAVPEATTAWLLLAGMVVICLAARRRAARSALALAAMVAMPCAWGAPDLIVSGYQLQSTKRISLTVYEYSYKVSATNRGTAASGAVAQVAAMQSWLTVGAGSLYFGRVGAGQTVTSADVFVVRQDRSHAFTAADLSWAFTASDASFSGRFEGAATATVASLIRNYVDDTPYSLSAVEIQPDRRRILRTELSITLAGGALVGQIQPMLDSLNATVIASLVDRSRIVVRIPDPGSVAALEMVRQRIVASPGVEDASLAVFPSPTLLPATTTFQPDTVTGVLDRDALSKYLGHHLAIRAHAAWNLEPRLNQPITGSPLVALPLLLIADSFGNGPPTPADGFNVLTTRTDYGSGVSAANAAQYHGYAVLEQIASSFGGNATPLDLSTGVIPGISLGIVVSAVDFTLLGPQTGWFKAALTMLSQRPERTMVLNASFVSSAGSNDHCDASGCTKPTQAETCALQKEALDLVHLMRGESAFSSLETRFLLVAGAGNDPAATAVEGSAIAYAGQTVVEYPPVCSFKAKMVQVPGLSNVLIVEGRFADATDLANAPTVGCPNGTTLIGNPLGVFSPGGQISGIGSVDRGIVLINGTPLALNRGVFAPYPFVKAPSSVNASAFMEGSSFATPQVAGVAMLAWSQNPTINAQVVKNLLVSTAYRNQSGPGVGLDPNAPPPPPDFQCPAGSSGFHATVDAYAALVGSDAPTGGLNLSSPKAAPVRLALLDVASVVDGQLVDQPDGKFTQADILAFLKAFERAKGALDYSRYDLNGDGRTGESYGANNIIIGRRRFDLDGDLKWLSAQQTVFSTSLSFDEVLPADISVLVYYAFSPLYTGNAYERDVLLLPYLSTMNKEVATLGGITLNITGVQQTALRMDQIDPPAASFSSLCPSGERGAYSQAVVSAATLLDGPKPVFWRPQNQGGRIANELPNAINCSSFIAGIASSGRMWINSASRTVNTASNKDVEYQTRIYLGEPDLGAAADPAGKLTPPAKRLSTQALSYGVIDSPGASFRTIENTRDFKLEVIDTRR